MRSLIEMLRHVPVHLLIWSACNSDKRAASATGDCRFASESSRSPSTSSSESTSESPPWDASPADEGSRESAGMSRSSNWGRDDTVVSICRAKELACAPIDSNVWMTFCSPVMYPSSTPPSSTCTQCAKSTTRRSITAGLGGSPGLALAASSSRPSYTITMEEAYRRSPDSPPVTFSSARRRCTSGGITLRMRRTVVYASSSHTNSASREGAVSGVTARPQSLLRHLYCRVRVPYTRMPHGRKPTASCPGHLLSSESIFSRVAVGS
mmetsp:Transcript_12946/g.32851  ORF Transcript_12946/g.32851 Transcript_12946/m.32851 type:complete len:266 (+) Transcript_12946:105-902(+)